MLQFDQARWFAEEVKPHEAGLRGYLQRRFPSLQDHDDVIQEAYSRILRVVGQHPISSAKGFLFTIARNLAIDMLRRQQAVSHEQISEVAAMPVLEESTNVVDSLEHQQRRELLVEAIASLPERCREVLMLRHIEGLAYKEIAERLVISPNTVKIHLVKGLRDCIAFFRAHGLLENGASSVPADRAKPVAR